MALDRVLLGSSLLVALSLVACGGSLPGNNQDASGQGAGTGQGGSTGEGGSTGQGGSSARPCAELDQCECLASAGRCTPRAEACWCPGECYAGGIDCICGGGRFLACEEPAASCTTALAAVKSKCVGQQGFAQYLDEALCASGANPSCVAGCLRTLESSGSCSEIDCNFCPVCDCLPSAPGTPFVACLQTCVPPLPEGAR